MNAPGMVPLNDGLGQASHMAAQGHNSSGLLPPKNW
jgi:hypothetical protein